MRVLFTSIAGVGHVNPMVPLAKALMTRGHEVRWATAGELAPLLAEAGIRAEPAGMALGAAMNEYRQRYPESAGLPPAEIPDHMGPKLFGEVAAPPMLRDLMPLARAFEPHLLVHDQGEFAGPIAAAALGIPAVTHAFGAQLPERRVAGAGEEAARLWREHGLEPRPFGGSYDTLYLDIYPPSLRRSSTIEVPRQSLRPWSVDGSADAGAFEMGGDPAWPLVYLTFGTVFRGEHLMRAAIEAISALDVRLLVTVGPAGDPRVLGRQPPNTHVERFVPQARILADCAVVVSHAGSGTFLAALAHGIPQLCLPQGADQFLNASAAAAADVGITLDPGGATRQAIGEAVGRLLVEDRYRRRAGELAGEIAAMPSPGEVAETLERLADTG